MKSSILIIGAILVLCSTNTYAATPAAKFNGPIPVTANSYPFMAAQRTLGALELSRYGYVEEEFIISGQANVYDWMADGSLNVLSGEGKYSTRILVRRPAKQSRFSGNVVVEIMNSARRYDWAMMFGYTHNFLLEHGDAWIGVTMPGGIAGLKNFNPARYTGLTFANPTPSSPCPGGAANSASEAEEGLRWDMLSQLGALLKSKAPKRPLVDLRVENVYMTSQNVDIVTYINAIHEHATLDNGKPVYDGYMVKSPQGPAKINRCATPLAKGDPRQIIRQINVPVIAVAAQGEVVANLAFRRPDGDAPDNRFRLYEIAGASHIDKSPYYSLAIFPDQMATGGNVQGTPEWPFTVKCDPEIPLTELPLMTYMFDAALNNLDQWVRKGIAPPRGTPIEIKNAGSNEASIVLDAFGNGKGGVRSPYVDVPIATYFPNSNGPGTCGELGHQKQFDSARIGELYASRAQYAARVADSVNSLVRQRWLTESDGGKIKAEALDTGRF